MRTVVVFCSDVINSLGLVRSLGEAGYYIECVCYGENRNYILGSKYVKKGFGFRTVEEATDYLVKEYPVKSVKPVIFTIPDPPAYNVDIHYDELKNKFIVFNAGEQGGVGHWMDKQNITNLAQKHGITVPWSIKLMKNEAIPDNLNYPVFVKSALSSKGGKKDESICYSKKELEEKQKCLISDIFIVMQFVDKVKEINYFGLSIKGHVYIDYHDVRDRAPKAGYGYYNSFHLCNYDDLHQRMINMIKDTNYQGLFDVEFLMDKDGKMYFTEVNFRVDGEIYKLVPGIDLSDYWCKLVDFSEQELPARLETKKNHFFGMTETDDFRVSVLSGRVNFFVWFWQFLTAERRMLFNLKDPKPVIIKIWDVIMVRIFKIKKNKEIMI